mgnify:FL=1
MFLDVLLQEGESIGWLSVVFDCARRSSLGLSSNTFLVVFALSEPLAELLSVVDFDKRDLVLLGKGSHELFVFWVFAVLGEDAEVSILSVQSLTDLVKTLNET